MPRLRCFHIRVESHGAVAHSCHHRRAPAVAAESLRPPVFSGLAISGRAAAEARDLLGESAMKRETTPASTSKKTRAKSTSAATAPANVVPMTPATPRPVAVKPAVARAKKSPASDAIALRAYELFEARQFEHGHDVEDW